MLALGACSNTNVETASKAHTSVTDIASYEYKANVVQDNVDVLLEWFTGDVKMTKQFMQSVLLSHLNLQLSVDIAVMNAKSTLADRINGRVSSQAKKFVSKLVQMKLIHLFYQKSKRLLRTLVNDVDVAGYKVAEQKIVSSGTQYRSFVLLEYSDVEAQKILLNRLRKGRLLLNKISATNAYKELDDAVNNTRKRSC